jgi:hypothetical protein
VTREENESVSGGGLLLTSVVVFATVSCGQSATSSAALNSYVAAVEPIRLGVNSLLNGADPVLVAYREHRLSGQQAASELGRLEQRFATYTVDINAVQPSDPTLADIHAPYAHTYVLEDSYLSALVATLPGGDFSSLPNTQSDQRAAIIEWRTQIEVLARKLDVRLPGDLQQAGRGEIAPAVVGTS